MKRAWMLAGAVLVAAAVCAEDLGKIQERMKARKEDVAALLAAKAVGENNKGYLEALQPLADEKQGKTVGEENADRKAVYTAIAAKTGAKPEFVGKSRAKDVAKIARKGTMIQQEDGTWTEKGKE